MSLDDQSAENLIPHAVAEPAASLPDDEDNSPFAPRSAPSFDRTPKAAITISRPGEPESAPAAAPAAPAASQPATTGSILQRMRARKVADKEAKKDSAARLSEQPTVAEKPKSATKRVLVKTTLGVAVTGALAAGAWYTQDYWWIPSVESMATLQPAKRAKIQATCDDAVKALPAPMRTKITQAHNAVQRALRLAPPDQAAYTAARDAVRAAETEARPELGKPNPILGSKCRNYREYLRLDNEQSNEKLLAAAAPAWATAVQQIQPVKAAHAAQVAAFSKETEPMAFNERINILLMGLQSGTKLSDLQVSAKIEDSVGAQLASFFNYGGGVDWVRQSTIYAVDPAAKTVFLPMANCLDGKTKVSTRKPLFECAAIDTPTVTDIIEVIPSKKLSVWLLSAHGWTVDGKPTRKGKGVANAELEAAANLTERQTDWSLTAPLTSQNRLPSEVPPAQVEGRPEVQFF